HGAQGRPPDDRGRGREPAGRAARPGQADGPGDRRRARRGRFRRARRRRDRGRAADRRRIAAPGPPGNKAPPHDVSVWTPGGAPMRPTSRMPPLAYPFAIVGFAAGWLSDGLLTNPLVDVALQSNRTLAAVIAALLGAALGAFLTWQIAPSHPFAETTLRWP